MDRLHDQHLDQSNRKTEELEDESAERKRMEKALWESEEKYRTMIDHSDDMIWTLDEKGNFLYFNKKSEEVTGYKMEDFAEKSFAPIIIDEDLKMVQTVFRETMQGTPHSYEVRIYDRSKKKLLTLSVNTAPILRDGKVIGTVSFGRDITERKNAEIALQESRAELDLIFRIAADGMCVIDADFNVTNVNKTFIRMVGMDKNEIIGKKCYDVFSGKLCHSKDCPLEKMKKGEGFVERESVKKRPDGKEIPVILNAARLDRNGTFAGIVADFKDITERKRVEEELKCAEERYRVIFEHTGVAMAIIEEDTTISLANKEFEVLCGYSKKEIEGRKSWTEFVAEEDSVKVRKYREEREKEGEAPTSYEAKAVDREGNIKQIYLSIEMIPGTKNSVVSLIDITEQKAAEEALNKKNEELDRFNRLTVGRELKMIELKKEINALLLELGKEPGYKIAGES